MSQIAKFLRYERDGDRGNVWSIALYTTKEEVESDEYNTIAIPLEVDGQTVYACAYVLPESVDQALIAKYGTRLLYESKNNAHSVDIGMFLNKSPIAVTAGKQTLSTGAETGVVFTVPGGVDTVLLHGGCSRVMMGSTQSHINQINVSSMNGVTWINVVIPGMFALDEEQQFKSFVRVTPGKTYQLTLKNIMNRMTDPYLQLEWGPDINGHTPDAEDL